MEKGEYPMSEALQKVSSKKIQWLITILLTAAIYLIPLTDLYTAQIRSFLMVTVFLILLVVFDLMSIMFVGVALPLGYILFGVAESNVALAGWTNDVSYLIIGAFVFAAILNQSGLLKRISLWVMMKVGGSYHAALFGFLAVGVLITFASYGNDGYLLEVLAYGFCVSLNIHKKPEGIVFMMASGVAAITARILTYYPIQMAPMIAAAQTVEPDFTIGIWDPLKYGLPIFIFIFLYIFVLCKVYKTSNKALGTSADAKKFFVDEYAKLGKITPLEIKAAILMIVITLYMSTSEWHGLNVNFAFMVFPWVCFLPFLKMTDEHTLDFLKDKLGLVFFATGCLAIANVASAIGATDLLAELLTPLLGHMNIVALLFTILALGMAANMLLTPLALVTTLATPIVVICNSLGIDLMAPLLSLFYTVDMLFLPHEVPAYLFIFSFGVMTMKDFIKCHLIKNVMFLAFFGVIIIPWWHFMGIL